MILPHTSNQPPPPPPTDAHGCSPIMPSSLRGSESRTVCCVYKVHLLLPSSGITKFEMKMIQKSCRLGSGKSKHVLRQQTSWRNHVCMQPYALVPNLGFHLATSLLPHFYRHPVHQHPVFLVPVLQPPAVLSSFSILPLPDAIFQLPASTSELPAGSQLGALPALSSSTSCLACPFLISSLCTRMYCFSVQGSPIDLSAGSILCSS